MSLEEADALVSSLSSRDIPDIWEVGGKKRVLRSDLDFKKKTLLLLYSSVDSAVLAEDLYALVEVQQFRNVSPRAFSVNLIRKNLVEYDRESDTVIISPNWHQVCRGRNPPRTRESGG